MVIDDISRHTELTVRPPEAPGVSNPFRSYVLIARVLRLLCGDPCQREPSDKINAPRRLSVVPFREVQQLYSKPRECGGMREYDMSSRVT